MNYRTREFLGTVLVFLTLAALIACLAGVMAGYNWLVYGDWTCAFKRCIEVMP